MLSVSPDSLSLFSVSAPSPEKLLEVAIGRILQRSHGVDLDAVTRASRSRLDTARLWALIQVYRYAAATGAAHLDAIAEELGELVGGDLDPSIPRAIWDAANAADTQ